MALEQLVEMSLLDVKAELPNMLSILAWAHNTQRWDTIVSLMNHLTYFLGTRGYWHERTHYGQFAINAAKQMGDIHSLARFKINIGWIRLNQGHFREARAHFEQGREILEELGEWARVCESMRLLGKVMCAEGKFDVARQIIDQALKIAKANNFTYSIHGLYGDLGSLAYAQGKYQDAQYFHQMALDGFQTEGHEENVASQFIDLGDATFAQGKITKAHECYKTGLVRSQKIGRQDNIANATFGLAVVSEHEGDFKAAINYARQAHDLFNRLGIRTGEAKTDDLIERLESKL